VEKKKEHSFESFKELITFVKDRPGHDYRYSINAEKINSALNWSPSVNLEIGIKKTVEWYLKNKNWLESRNN